jgi:hypothetical protein
MFRHAMNNLYDSPGLFIPAPTANKQFKAIVHIHEPSCFFHII